MQNKYFRKTIMSQNWWRKKYSRFIQNLTFAMIKRRIRGARGFIREHIKKLSRESSLWTNKYEPKHSKDLQNHQYIVNSFRCWLNKWEYTYSRKKEKKAVIFNGPSGVGKTLLARIVSKESGFEVLELKPSDFSDEKPLKNRKTDIFQMISDLTTNHSVSIVDQKQRNILIVDDLDSLSSEIIKSFSRAIPQSKTPIIFISGNKYRQKVRELREMCYELNFQRFKTHSIMKIVHQIAIAEGFRYGEKFLKDLAKTSDGDLRLAINQLQFIKSSNKLSNFSKDIVTNPYALYEMFVEQTVVLNIRDRLNMVVQNFELLRSILREKFSSFKVYATSKYDALSLHAKITEGVSVGDEILSFVRNKQKWSLIPFVSLNGIIYPSDYAKKMKAVFVRRNYSKLKYSRASSVTKHQNIRNHLSQSQMITANQMIVQIDYFCLLKKYVFLATFILKAQMFVQTVAAFHIYRIQRKDIFLLKMRNSH